MEGILIEKMIKASWKEVSRIYNAGIATKNATFEKQAPSWETWDRSHRKDCRLVATADGRIAGWAALSNVSDRCVYSGVAEVSIYVDPEFRGMGVGGKLMTALINESENTGIWTLQAGIFPENAASIKLHHKHGFRTVGIREKLGRLEGAWRDVALLERRSKRVGID